MELTYEQLYGFDAVGYLHVPGILDRAALQQCHRASDIVTAAAELTAEHPVLEACLGRLFGGGAEAIHRQSPVPENLNLDATLGLGTWRLDTPPRLAVASDACRGSSGAGRFLHDGGGSGHLDARRVRYASESGVILAQGVTAMWALEGHPRAAEDGTSLTIIPASHKSCFPAPAAVLSGERSVRTAVRLLMGAGDLLLLATPTLWRYSDAEQRLLLSDYTPASVFPSGGCGSPPPCLACPSYCRPADCSLRARTDAPPPPSPEDTAWLSELSPEARAVVAPRLLGGGAGGETVQSDGEKMWMGQADPAPPVVVPPGLTDEQAWEWDLNGFLVMEGVMDAEWLADAAAAVAACGHMAVEKSDVALTHFTEDGQWPARTSPRLKGGGKPHRMLEQLTELPAPHAQPFRRMIVSGTMSGLRFQASLSDNLAGRHTLRYEDEHGPAVQPRLTLSAVWAHRWCAC